MDHNGWGLKQWVITVFIMILLSATAFEHYKHYKLRVAYDSLSTADAQTIDGLKSILKSKDNELVNLQFKNGRLLLLTRSIVGGQLSGGGKDFIPPEGGVDVKITKSGTGISEDIHIIDKGFTVRPGIGILYSGKLTPEFDIKMIYFLRYSAKVGVTPDFADAGISRHVDDLPMLSLLRNLEAQLVARLNYAGGWGIGLGIRTNL